tara:strand:- start:573 stop:1799 length:1227 start_codon:yes stop_codon:yes gene_type:complete
MASEYSIIPSCIRWRGFKEDDLISGTTPLLDRYSDAPVYGARVWAPDTLTLPSTYPAQPTADAWENIIQYNLASFGAVPDSWSAGSSYKPRCTIFNTALIAGRRVESAVASIGFRNTYASGDTNHYKNVSLAGVSGDWEEGSIFHNGGIVSGCLEYKHEYRGTGAVITKYDSDGLKYFAIDYDSDTRERRRIYRIPPTCEEDPLPIAPDDGEWWDYTFGAIPEGSAFTTPIIMGDTDAMVDYNLATEWEDNVESVTRGASLSHSGHIRGHDNSIWTQNLTDKNPTLAVGVKSVGAKFHARILVAGLKEGSYSVEYPIFTRPYNPDDNSNHTLSEISVEWKTTTVSVANDFQISFSEELTHNAAYNTTTSYGGFSLSGVSGRPDSIQFKYNSNGDERIEYVPLLKISES